MSDEFPGPQSMAEPEPMPGAPLTAGGLIRQAREASGLHIAALAVSLKVPVKKLEALEADQFDGLHDSFYVRALAARVCRALHIDPAQVLDRLPQRAAPALPPKSGINTPFQAAGGLQGLALGVRLRHPAVLAVLALLLGAAIVGFLPELQRTFNWPWTARPQASSAAASPVVPVSVAPPGAPEMPGAGADAPTGTVLENVTRAPAPSESTAPLAVVSNGAASDPMAVVGSLLESNAGANAIVAFKARAAAWIEVTDARGVVVLRRTLLAGESTAASGALPLQAVVGRADAVEVQVRGKPLDLAPVSKENVARFEVK